MPEWTPERQISLGDAARLATAAAPELTGYRATAFAEGWDNTVVLFEQAQQRPAVFRFPRREIALPGIRREVAWLPLLAPRLPLAVPVPVWSGEWEAGGSAWPFWGGFLVPGEELAAAQLSEQADVAPLATELGGFLRRLHSLQPHDFAESTKAAPLAVDPYRRADPRRRRARTMTAVDRLARAGLPLAVNDIAELLAQACALADSEGEAEADLVVCHGDLHGRHVLVTQPAAASGESGLERGVAVTGVIDWGDLCLADRSIDLPLAYCGFDGAGRRAFFAAYGSVTDDHALRARALGIFLNAVLAEYALDLPTIDKALLTYAIQAISRALCP